MPNTPATPKPPAKTRKVTIPNVAFDPEFLRQVAGYKKNYTDATAGLRLQRSQYDAQYKQNMEQLGWNPVTKRFNTQDAASQYGQSRTDLMDDYAARGMGSSGAYAKDAGAMNTDYRRRATQATTAKTQFGDNIHQQAVIAGNARNQSIGNARASAVQAIAAKYGVDTGVVPQDPKGKKKKTVTIPVTG